MPDEDDIQARLKALREAYAKQLPDKLTDIARQWASMQHQPWDFGQVKSLHRQIHTLAGSAPTFGFDTVGQQARHAENLLKTWNNEQRTPGEDEIAGLTGHIHSLCNGLDSNPTPPSPSASSLVERMSTCPPERRLIFLIDNDEALIGGLPQLLSHFDYQVRVFRNAGGIDEAFAKERPAALIVNPGLDDTQQGGTALVHGLKARYGQDLPVIFVSTRGDFNSRLQAVRSGGDTYFVKPIDIAPLVDHLDRVTQSHTSEAYRVLVVEDDPDLAAHYALTLRQAGIDTTILSRLEDILTTLAEVRPELILMDVYMPRCSGLELAQLIRQQDDWLSIPIVFLSSETDMEKQFNAMRIGGDDFLTKPIDSRRLVASVSIRAERARTLNILMVKDSLTGLLKHTKIKEKLAADASRASRAGEPLVFGMLDIDHFKRINDRYGHLCGDRVIKSLARLLQQRLRQSDGIGRYGGEEFAVVLPGCSLAAGEQVLNQIRAGFAKLRFRHGDEEFSVTLSAGIASVEQFRDAESINRAADEALYTAKRSGRNRVKLCQAPAAKFPENS
ncbi:diguanylate cyclase (GGDEF domain) with PAS/PAC sensor [hydrothermal vent metagenome]|uniref:Diguanylate cyclase (GGDEF domain) with PAS/PAC sensor n=1 Tax=hydrothermal vent metagenome TaxID=652676 RepID=A0A3B0ZUC6_9ZZZZ